MQVEVSAQASQVPSSPFAITAIAGVRSLQRSQEPAIDARGLKFRRSALRLCVFVAALTMFGPSLVAQTGDVTISTNTTWATGTYSLTSLSVVNGAVLTVGGGSTVTV